jgi:hypothetical protein
MNVLKQTQVVAMMAEMITFISSQITSSATRLLGESISDDSYKNALALQFDLSCAVMPSRL